MIVIDASVIICILMEEPETPRFISLLAAETGNLRMSAANYLEAAIVIDSKRDSALSEKFDRLIDQLQIEIVAVAAEHAKQARNAYRSFGKGYHAAKLNFGDCFAYALAKIENAPLLFKGGDFAKTDVLRAI